MAEAPDAEEFEAWRALPVTEFVMAGLVNAAEAAMRQWQAAAWFGNIDPVTHARVKARVEAYSELANLSFEDALGANGMEPKNGQPG